MQNSNLSKAQASAKMNKGKAMKAPPMPKSMPMDPMSAGPAAGGPPPPPMPSPSAPPQQSAAGAAPMPALPMPKKGSGRKLPASSMPF